MNNNPTPIERCDFHAGLSANPERATPGCPDCSTPIQEQVEGERVGSPWVEISNHREDCPGALIPSHECDCPPPTRYINAGPLLELVEEWGREGERIDAANKGHYLSVSARRDALWDCAEALRTLINGKQDDS